MALCTTFAMKPSEALVALYLNRCCISSGGICSSESASNSILLRSILMTSPFAIQSNAWSRSLHPNEPTKSFPLPFGTNAIGNLSLSYRISIPFITSCRVPSPPTATNTLYYDKSMIFSASSQACIHRSVSKNSALIYSLSSRSTIVFLMFYFFPDVGL